MAKKIYCAFGTDIDSVAGWIGSYGGGDSPSDIQRGIFAKVVVMTFAQLPALRVHLRHQPVEIALARWRGVLGVTVSQGHHGQRRIIRPGLAGSRQQWPVAAPVRGRPALLSQLGRQ